ncbi:hypothetical protein B0H13DRAFT_2353642 [Mycena leptocephala]|nr:hypothetical protein B0H13DRAFT_2353642 [Mycena leptocephala]
MRSRGRNLHNTTTPRTRRTLTPLPPPMQRIARLRHPSIHTRSIPGPHDFPHPRSSPPTSFPSPLRPPRLFARNRASHNPPISSPVDTCNLHGERAGYNLAVPSSSFSHSASSPASTAAPSSHDCPQDRTPIRRSLPLFTREPGVSAFPVLSWMLRGRGRTRCPKDCLPTLVLTHLLTAPLSFAFGLDRSS